MAGRVPDRILDKEGLNNWRKYCFGKALQEKLAEDRAKRLEHQRNDVIKVKEGEN